MSQSTSSRWDLGRFFKTMAYFGAIPLLSELDWFQQWLGSRSHPRLSVDDLAPDSAMTASSQVLLLLNGATPLGHALAQSALAAGYQVRSLISVHQAPTPTLPAEVTAIPVDFHNPDSLPSSLLAQVDHVIVCDDTLPPAFLQALLTHWTPKTPQRSLFDFGQPTGNLAETWGAIDDVVMGGVSESGLRLGPKSAFFTGVVSTANSGGFASVRTRNFEPPLDLSPYDGVALRVRGDGQRYKFMLRTEGGWDSVAYCASFDTVAGQWCEVRLPFQELVPVFRAKTQPQLGALAAERVRAFQLMLSKFEYDGALNPHFSPGAFQLEIEAIAAYRASHPAACLVLTSQSSSPIADCAQASPIPCTLVSAADPDAALQRCLELLQGQPG